jgi:hypothetical protein
MTVATPDISSRNLANPSEIEMVPMGELQGRNITFENNNDKNKRVLLIACAVLMTPLLLATNGGAVYVSSLLLSSLLPSSVMGFCSSDNDSCIYAFRPLSVSPLVLLMEVGLLFMVWKADQKLKERAMPYRALEQNQVIEI